MNRLLFLFFVLLSATLSFTGHAQEFRQDSSVAEKEGELLLPEGWVSLAGMYSRVHGPPEQALKLESLLAHAEQSVPAFAKRLDLPTGKRVEIFLTQSQEQFFALQPGDVPRWADATAYSKQAWIFLRKNSLRGGMASSDTQVLDHEIVHVILGQAFQDQRPPRWLQEGTAQVLAGEYGTETVDRIANGFFGRGLFSLGELSHPFPQDPVRAQLAYAQSADFIAWLIDRHGETVLQSLVKASLQGASFEASLRKATGESISDLDRAWSKRLKNSWLWVRAIANDTVLLGLSSLLLFVAYARVRRRNKKRLEEMARQEALEDRLAELLAEKDALGNEPPFTKTPPQSPWIH